LIFSLRRSISTRSPALRSRSHDARIVVGVRGDRGDHHLHRREPQREVPGKFSIRMPVKRSIEPQMARWIITGASSRRIGVDVEGAEALRQVEVDLRRAALPVAADGVAQHIFELRPVERALARIDAGLDAAAGLRARSCSSTSRHDASA
jgi:hypothetical protein